MKETHVTRRVNPRAKSHVENTRDDGGRSVRWSLVDAAIACASPLALDLPLFCLNSAFAPVLALVPIPLFLR